MVDIGFRYVLTSKFNQDPLERHFGILRSLTCDDHPSTVDFLHLHMLQCLYIPIKNTLSNASNIEDKEEATLTSFVNQMRVLAKQSIEETKQVSKNVFEKIQDKLCVDKNDEGWETGITTPEHPISVAKKCLVYHLAGYIMRHANKVIKCSSCIFSLRSDPKQFHNMDMFTKLKDYGFKRGEAYLIYPSQNLVCIFLEIEEVLIKKLSTKGSLWGDIFQKCLEEIDPITVKPTGLGCSLEHSLDILPKLVFHYIKCRFYFYTKQIRNEIKSAKHAQSSRKFSKVADS